MLGGGGGGGGQTFNLPWEGNGYFLEQHDMTHKTISQYLNTATNIAQGWLSVFLDFCVKHRQD